MLLGAIKSFQTAKSRIVGLAPPPFEWAAAGPRGRGVDEAGGRIYYCNTPLIAGGGGLLISLVQGRRHIDNFLSRRCRSERGGGTGVAGGHEADVPARTPGRDAVDGVECRRHGSTEDETLDPRPRVDGLERGGWMQGIFGRLAHERQIKGRRPERGRRSSRSERDRGGQASIREDETFYLP